MSAMTATRPEGLTMPIEAAQPLGSSWSSVDRGPQSREARMPDGRRLGSRLRPVGRPRRRSDVVPSSAQRWTALWLRTPKARLARACRGEARVQPALVRSAVRSRATLTDRGIAVILVAGAMIVLAAVTVVTLTALRVTSEGFQPVAPAPAVPVALPLGA